ncbi:MULTISPECIES: hypothetical protein [unclassified Pseudomonas]|uniref:hypothetical protein n=1 Tax=unclassified Pseudomonas TaxID=196821 RepID=UPI0011476F21|nr:MULTISPECIES: hypothetical protein [unclassified Pseudomonas]QJI33988.1 hypothetical protein HKK54_06055 [Pseudomonas sp. ADAK13]
MNIDFKWRAHMAVFLVPFAAAIIGGLVVTGVGIGVNESRKSKAEADAKIKETASRLLDKANELITAGTLYPAYRAGKEYVEHMKNNFELSPGTKQGLEETLNTIKETAEQQYRNLKEAYKKDAGEAGYDDSGVALYYVQEKYLGDLEKLLGAGAPHLKVVEDSFGVNYQVHKQGLKQN